MPRSLSKAEVSDFRDRLCDAAATIFAERGREGFTLRELANALGVSAMTPYRYFHDKDEILAAVRTRAFNAFAKALEQAFGAPGTALEKGSAAARAYFRFALDDPTSYKLMFDLSQDDERYPELKSAAVRSRATLTQHIYPLVKAGLVAGDPELIGHAFWAFMHGAVMLRLAGKLDCDFDALVEQGMAAMTRGFGPDGVRRGHSPA
jgi:AcrR family transcriptional regulator